LDFNATNNSLADIGKNDKSLKTSPGGIKIHGIERRSVSPTNFSKKMVTINRNSIIF
jgi:hypothetical protein